jgi:hypothetical protein
MKLFHLIRGLHISMDPCVWCPSSSTQLKIYISKYRSTICLCPIFLDLPKPKYMFPKIVQVAPNINHVQILEEMLQKTPRVGSTDRAGSPCDQSFLFFIYLLFSLCEQADSVLYGVDAISDQRQYDKHYNDDDEDDEVSRDHDACGLR